MSGLAAAAAVAGLDAGFVAGISWVPESALGALAYGTAPSGPAESLVTVVSALELDFAFVPGDVVWAVEAVELLHDSGAAAFWSVPGVLGRLGEELGWVETLKLTAAEPGALAAPLASALHDALDAVRSGLDAGADAIVIADDLAGPSGLLVSPDFVLDALVPCYHSLARETFAGGGTAVFHADGDVRAFMPALAKAGFSAIHLGQLTESEFDASLAAARASSLVVVGGIDVSRLLEGARHLGARAGAAASAGGLVVCDDGGFTLAEEIAAYSTAVEAARDAYGDDGGAA